MLKLPDEVSSGAAAAKDLPPCHAKVCVSVVKSKS